MARIALLLLLSVVTLYLCMIDAQEVSCGRKCLQNDKPSSSASASSSSSVKKYGPTDDLKLSSGIASLKSRSPRQTVNEQRQYYPCMTCFKLGSREVCTNPYCPSDDFQCDKASKRCHKKARVGASRPAASAPASDDAPAADDA